MNEPDPLDEAISHFRELAPPAEVSVASRSTLRAALERPVVTHWWQRSVAIPLPAALATAAALVLSLSTHVFHSQPVREVSKPETTVAPPGAGDVVVGAIAATTAPQFEYSETQSYLSGVGVVGRRVVFQIKEPLR